MARLSQFIDTSKCTGCRGCQVACKNWNQKPAEILEFKGKLQTHETTSPDTLTFVKMFEKYENGKHDWFFMKTGCMHCTEAACEKVCPQDAISHTETGAVVRDPDKCIGCGYCAQFCPFGIPKVKEEKQMYKCTLCAERVENNMNPACSNTCPAVALNFGPREELVNSAKERLEIVKKNYPNANLYGLDDQFLGGTNVFYLLLDKPETYGLNPKPEIPAGTEVWQNVIQPAGKILPLGVAGVVLASAFMNRVKAVRQAEGKHHDKGGSIDG